MKLFAGAGAHLGLTVVLDAQLDNYYCQTTNGAGFKVKCIIINTYQIFLPSLTDCG